MAWGLGIFPPCSVWVIYSPKCSSRQQQDRPTGPLQGWALLPGHREGFRGNHPRHSCAVRADVHFRTIAEILLNLYHLRSIYIFHRKQLLYRGCMLIEKERHLLAVDSDRGAGLDTVEVGSLHTLRLKSLKQVFQPLHKFLVNKLKFWEVS